VVAIVSVPVLLVVDGIDKRVRRQP
jgi:hypothetical protein